MNERAPFQPSDLVELEAFLDRADAVMPMETIAAGLDSRNVIGMRHDVDNVLAPAVAMAQWEAEHGYRSTYFILHTAPYWQDKDELCDAIAVMAECGHEIGFHINAITAAIWTGQDPMAIIADTLGELRSHGYPVHGVVAHGDRACYEHNFVNDEVFLESPRPSYGHANRVVGNVRLAPVSRTAFGFDYDPNWLPRAQYLSDSGGEWSQPFAQLTAQWPFDGQLHMLVHPDWWGEAFTDWKTSA